MPIFFEHEIDFSTKLAIWKIEEPESFFAVPLQRSITHPHKRLQHLAGRFLLKYLFSDFPLQQILIADTRKPYLEDEAFHFSISHCGDFAAAIVSRHKRVGVDIEIPTERVQRIRNKFLHAEENQYLIKTVTRFTDTELLTLFWSGKEAVFKWWSFGGVDFSEMIRIREICPAEQQLKTRFLTSGSIKDLQIHYRSFENLHCCWVADS